MWIHENGTGLRVTAQIEDAREMVKEGGTHSVLWPRGKPEEEEAEFKKREAADLALIPEPEKVEEKEGAAVEVHHSRRRHATE